MAKKRRPRTKSKKSFKLKLKTATYYSITQITFFSLSALVVVSFLRQGIILSRINDILTSFFGWTTFLLPFVFLTFGLLVSRFKTVLSQPNVVVGSVLLFLSLTALTRSGTLGSSSWDGISTLITAPGAFIVLFASSVVGIVVMFNTSLDQVAKVLVTVFRQYGIRGNKADKKFGLPKKEMRVIGETGTAVSFSNKPMNINENKLQTFQDAKKEVLEQKLVSNLPGDDRVWRYPSLELLSDTKSGKADRGDIKNNAHQIEQTLESFGITAHVVEVNLGPAVTQYALEVALGTKLSKITALERDLALALAAPTGTIRIEAPIPGRSMVGIELPNRSPEFVPLRNMMESEVMRGNKSKLGSVFGTGRFG
jgi:DNA segregation ATPase FtsK/SpoIIIE, S-DNA-T family